MNKQTCPSRINQLGPWENKEGLDEWKTVGPDRVCSFCGSLHPEELEPILDQCITDEGVIVTLSPKGYKVYLRRPGIQNASDGAIKYYMWHALSEAGDARRVLDKLHTALELSREKLSAKGGRTRAKWEQMAGELEEEEQAQSASA
jgi:Cdc6-like AAA superfamily ATPase